MVNITTLLPELRALVTELAEDLLARSNADTKIDAGLREAFKQIEKGGRTAQAFEVWRDDYLDQVAVAWVLACVFVRFMEDNHLIDEFWLAGEGDRRKLAEGAHEIFFRKHPHDTDREYFEHVFREVGKIPAAKELFAEGKTPLWAVGPSGDAAMKLLAFWREIDPEEGHLLRSFEVEKGDTRFLGDLYQDLSEKARKKYALLQTPVFVEEFILDRTLTPALDEFGLEKVRLIDPTCGSGHFLLGAFARLFRLWLKKESNEIVAAQKALDGVWGVDINPFAVAIARFRLTVAAVEACGIKRLKQAPGWTIHLATGDSLLFGSKPGWKGERTPLQQQGNLFEVEPIYAVEDPAALREILGQGYHVVVGNPPYITVKDKAQNEACRNLYSTCHRKFSLGVPFTQRFWELAIQQGETSNGCGYIGEITANSFMKREFGKKLIEDFFPKVDLTHVIDTSGAYIPGHGTPTVILLGRSRKPMGESVRAVLGIKGEPSSPENPAFGLVWQSIIKQIDIANEQNEFISTADVPRATFAHHPWSVGGGGVGDLMELLEDFPKLQELVAAIGFMAIAGDEDVYLSPSHKDFVRKNVAPDCIRTLVDGQVIRDWTVDISTWCLFDYNESLTLQKTPCLEERLWPYRSLLSQSPYFGKTKSERGLDWREWAVIVKDKFQSRLSIFFANVATHNHFFLDRGELLGGSTAQVIKLPITASESDYLEVLGLLNSSTACFWIKQVFYPKGSAVGDISSERGKPEANRYQIAGTGLLSFPVPKRDSASIPQIRTIAKSIEEAARRSVEVLPGAILGSWEFKNSHKDIGQAFNEAAFEYEKAKMRMIALQEELDWEVYKSYGLTDEGASKTILEDTQNGVGSEHRPFMWENETPPGGLPASWIPIYEKRRRLRGSVVNLKLIESIVFKRPWWGRQGVYGQATRTYKEWMLDACREWMVDRLESPKFRRGNIESPELTTTAQMADVASADEEFLQVAALYRGRPDFDVAALVAELVEGESVPFLPMLRYKPTGLRKRAVWERIWDLQRQEDSGEEIDEIPISPKYISADFVKADYWRLRGKLDVPKERWVSYPHCSTENDPSLVVGWAGWNHLQQATALIAYYDARKREGWTANRLTPLLAGLDQLLPWIHQWHPEIDKEFGETAGKSFQTMLEHDAHELGLTLEEIRQWTPPATTTRRRARK